MLKHGAPSVKGLLREKPTAREPTTREASLWLPTSKEPTGRRRYGSDASLLIVATV